MEQQYRQRKHAAVPGSTEDAAAFKGACCCVLCASVLQAPTDLRGCARQFDSIKRADYNFRGEQLDWQDKRMYVPRANKNEFNERHDSSTHRLSVPPALSRTEFPVHSALISKVRSPAPFPPPSTRSDVLCTPRSQTRWDGATGSGGDPYAAEKAHEAKGLAMLQFARDNSGRRPPRARETLVRRHACSSRARRRVGGGGVRPWQWGVVASRASECAPARYRCPCSPLPCCVSGGTRGAPHARGPRRQSRKAEVGGARRGVAAAATTAVWTRRARDVQAGARAQDHDLVARWLLRCSGSLSLFAAVPHCQGGCQTGDGIRERSEWRCGAQGGSSKQLALCAWSPGGLSELCLLP